MQKNDLVSRERLLDAVCGCFNIMEAKGIDMTAARAIVNGVIGGAPAIDAAPVVHGRWIRHETEDGNYFGYDCSECGIWISFGESQNMARFCPDCGARMSGDDDAK